MQNYKVLIVDDEVQSRSLVKKLLSVHFPNVIIYEADNVTSAAEVIGNNPPKLIFLDVQMRGETGFDLLDKIGTDDFGIIFTTAHSEFALKAFRYSAMDYLMKPIDTEEFKATVAKALDKIGNNKSSIGQIDFLKELKTGNKVPDKVAIPTTEGFLFITINHIVYCHAVGNYTEFHVSDNAKIVSSYTLGYYAELLHPHNFFRVHRSYLINLNHVKMYKKASGGIVLMNNGDEIEVSRNSREELLKALQL